MMNSTAFLRSAAILFLVVGCSKNGSESSHKEFIETTNGVIVKIEGADNAVKNVRLEVVADNIIRVTASAADTFSTAKSLMVIARDSAQTKFSIAEASNEITLSTLALKAKVVKTTGEIIFTDTA